jgi:hypothetical protein
VWWGSPLVQEKYQEEKACDKRRRRRQQQQQHNNNNNNNNKELQENRNIGHLKHTSESASVKVQNIFHGRHNIICSMNCNYRTAATLYAQETWLFTGI